MKVMGNLKLVRHYVRTAEQKIGPKLKRVSLGVCATNQLGDSSYVAYKVSLVRGRWKRT